MKNVIFLGIVILFLTGSSLSQNSIEKTDENRMLLELLVKQKIDSVRLKNKCVALKTDSILYKASRLHSDYQRDKGHMTHNQENKDFATPQDRVNYFGGTKIFAGENVMTMDLNTTVFTGSGRSYSCFTVESTAHAILDMWLNSAPHKNNILNTKYILTGVTISFDQKNNRLYATQVFGAL